MLIRLLAAIALLLLGHGLQGILLGVRASIEGSPDAMTGTIMSAFFAGFIAGSFLGPRIIEQAGHTRAFAALASLASIVTLSHALFVDEILWAVLRAVHGACFAILVMVAESWLNSHVNDHIGREEHVGAASALLIVYGSGAVLGPLAGGVVMGAYGAPALFGLVGAAFALLGAFGLWRMLVRAPVPAREQADFVAVTGTTHMASDLDPRGVERDDRRQGQSADSPGAVDE